MTIDSIYRDTEFGEFIKSACSDNQYDGLIAVTNFVDDEKPLWTGIDEDYKITGFGDEFKSPGFVTGGIYFFRKGIIEHTDTALANNKVSLRNFLQYLIEAGIKLKAVPFSKIIDVDHAVDIDAAENFLQENRK